MVDNEALLQRYRKEIEELRAKLAEKDREHGKGRRLSAREVSRSLIACPWMLSGYYPKQKEDERRDTDDLTHRLQQLSKLILTSNTVAEGRDSRSASPTKADFDLSPYDVGRVHGLAALFY